MEGWTLHLVEPSHFHAALLLQKLDSRIPGPIIVHGGMKWNEAPFLGWVHSLVSCNWDIGRLKVARSQDPIAKILGFRGRSLALLAGQNSLKADRVLRLLQANVPVLCDKPLWTNANTGKGLSDFLRITNQDIFLDDCMTERFEPTFELQRLLLSEKLPGFEMRPGQPGRVRFHLCNTHHLSKTVGGVSVGREESFFETRTNGDPFADVGTHLVDHYLRLMTALGASTVYLDENPGKVESYWENIDGKSLSISSETGAIPFPIRQVWNGGNGATRAKIATEWYPSSGDQIPPESQSSVVHGECGALSATHYPSTNSMVLDLIGLPVGERAEWNQILQTILSKLPQPWPKTQLVETRYGIQITHNQSPILDHPARFPLVFNQFLDRIQQNRPLTPFERKKLLQKYAISAESPRNTSQSLNP